MASSLKKLRELESVVGSVAFVENVAMDVMVVLIGAASEVWN